MTLTTKVADTIYFNGYIYTADDKDSVQQALAIHDGFIIAVGSNEQIKSYVGDKTEQVDLNGKMMMPGIIDSHMHPFWGGEQLSGCHLNYEALTIEQILVRIQKALDTSPLTGKNDWLQVRAWLRQGMLPTGADITRADLDSLNSQRPIILFSNDCHTLACNSRALELFGIDENTAEPTDGKIVKDAQGRLTGILEDAPAMRAFDSIPSINPLQAEKVAELVQNELNKQGVTMVMDTRVSEKQLIAFKGLQDRNALHLRVRGAREITPDDVPTPADAAQAVVKAAEFAKQFDQPEWTPTPGIAVTNIKLFVDGVLQPPTMTASLLAPYRKNRGSVEKPDWQPTENYGDLYFSAAVLDALIYEIAVAGFDPHLHTVGEGAISISLDAIEKMRNRLPSQDIRPGLAHNELVASKDYVRFAQLNAIAALSFQWAAPSSEMVDEERHMLGEQRFENLEPIAKFIDAGAKIVFGSDWPIDALDEWYDLKVAATRRGRAINGTPAPRLDNDRDLTIHEVLRSATIDAAYALRCEKILGSLVVGKFADLIVLDRNPFQNPPDELENVKVLLTVVGGKTVYTMASSTESYR